jgi:hypothetical protein
LENKSAINLKPSDRRTGVSRYLELVGLPILWAVFVFLAVQFHQISTAEEHSICGPWGCGPPTKTLIAVHLGWLAIIGPPLIYFPNRLGWKLKSVLRLAVGLISVGLLGLMILVAWQWFVWLPQSAAAAQDYIWQRCGFSIATAVDLPLVQLLVTGIALLLVSRRRANFPDTIREKAG